MLKCYFNDLLVILVMGFNRLDTGKGGMVGRGVAVFWWCVAILITFGCSNIIARKW